MSDEYISDVDPKIACHNNYDDDHTDNVKYIHCLMPSQTSVNTSHAVPSSLFHHVLQSTLHVADGILDFASGLLGLAIRLQLRIAYRFADGLLDRAFDLVRGSRDPIFIHDYLLQTC